MSCQSGVRVAEKNYLAKGSKDQKKISWECQRQSFKFPGVIALSPSGTTFGRAFNVFSPRSKLKTLWVRPWYARHVVWWQFTIETNQQFAEGLVLPSLTSSEGVIDIILSSHIIFSYRKIWNVTSYGNAIRWDECCCLLCISYTPYY